MGDRGAYATGPYRTPATLVYATRTGSHISYLIHGNKHRKAVKMRRQRNMAQMKEQNKTPEKELHKVEINNLTRYGVENTGY